MTLENVLNNLEKIENSRLVQDFFGIIYLPWFGAFGAAIGIHIIPHVYARGYRGNKAINDTQRVKVHPRIVDRIQMAEIWAGGAAGLAFTGYAYYGAVDAHHPELLAIPIITNLVTGIYAYKSRK